MNILMRIIVLFLFILTGSTAYAAEAGQWEVVGIYVREADSLFIDVKMAPRKFHDAQRWAEVKKLQAAEGAPRAAEMVPVPANMNIVEGDIVALDLPRQIKQIQGLLPERAKITALIAKAGGAHAAATNSSTGRLSAGAASAR